MGAKFDLDEALGFYGSYHTNFINQLIHVVFVPCIVWSAMVIFNYINLSWLIGEVHLSDLVGVAAKNVPAPLSFFNDNLVISAALFMAIGLTWYYLTLTFFPSLTYCIVFLWPLLLTATSFYHHTPAAWQYALALQVFSWYMQIHPGHAIFEQRNAALTDNFWAGLLAGPLFAWFEVLFWCGWNPQLRARLQVKIDANLTEFRAKEASKAK